MATNGKNNGTYKGVVCRKDLRLAIYLRDSFRCVYCCKDLHGAHPTDITLDRKSVQLFRGETLVADVPIGAR